MRAHLVQRVGGAAGAAEALHQRGGVCAVATQAEPEDQLAFGAVVEREMRLQRGAGVQPRAHSSGQVGAGQGGRRVHAAVAAQEFAAVAIDAACRVVHVEEGHPIGELGVVRVAGEQCAAGRVGFGHHVHRGLRAQVAEQPLDVGGDADSARAARVVAQLQHRELHRGIQRHVDPQLGADAVFHVLEHAVAETVAGGVAAAAATRQRGR